MFSGIGRVLLLSTSALVSLSWLGGVGSAQTPENPPASPAPAATPGQSVPGTLPTITVETTKKKPPPKKQAVRQPPQPAQSTTETAQAIAERQIQTQVTTFNDARSNIFTSVGANNSNSISNDDIQKLPQGDNQTVDKVLLQFPGVTQDSAASGNLHVRNEHANLAYRINGVMLPDGVTGFGSILRPA